MGSESQLIIRGRTGHSDAATREGILAFRTLRDKEKVCDIANDIGPGQVCETYDVSFQQLSLHFSKKDGIEKGWDEGGILRKGFLCIWKTG